jgi:murein DD-endopeptidase MepM/ murein hydrolase activator NlpD
MNQSNKLLITAGLAAISLLVAYSAAASPAPVIWQPPLNPPLQLINKYRQPNSDYSAGHRGVDYLARLDQSVLAPADGQVLFARPIYNRGVLSINHGNGILTEFEPVCSDFAVGELVFAGQEIGRICDADASYPGHCGNQLCMHFSVRQHGRYLSPLIFMGLANPSRLLPIYKVDYARG